MCGIAGWIDWQRDLTRQRSEVEAMTRCMAHRGPDGYGVWLSPRAALGHHRLAVIDPAGGAQPMRATPAGPDGPDVVLVYSGEIYNYRELRSELVAHGHRFRTTSDTEVLLHAYLQWGEECLARLNGMFAFAIWDGRSEQLLLARDRLGIKPLYYTVRGSAFLFGSEPKVLLANPLYEPEVDHEGLAELFGLWPFKTPGHALYRDVRDLPPGRFVRVSRAGVGEEAYWSLRNEPHVDDLETTARRVREILADTVSRQLVADVPLCALLSGGLDSSFVVALAASQLGDGALRTFCVDLVGDDEEFVSSANRPSRDAPYARQVAAAVGTDHEEFVVSAQDLFEAQEAVLRARDLPTMGDLDASLYLLFGQISGRATVALSGESADESFGGYPWFEAEWRQPSHGFPWHRGRRRFSDWLRPEVTQSLKIDEYVADRYSEAVAAVPDSPEDSPEDRHMRRVSHLNLRHFLPALLDRKDRTSMAVGLEVRVPYCDHRLVEYLWNVPWRMKTADGVVKGLLRLASRGVVPDAVRNRRKSAYPLVQNTRYEKAVTDRVRGILADRESPLAPMLDHAAVTRTLRQVGSAAEGPVRVVSNLSMLVSMDAWLRTYHVRVR